MTFAIPAAISAAGSIAGGFLSKPDNQETKRQKQSRKVADELISSLKGDGPFSNLFNLDEDAFQKSYVDPAKSMFKNQIAPQIQQQYIASGQQRNTGLDDQLLRAGVDLDQLLNQEYMKWQQAGNDRAMNSINGIIGQNAGAPNPMSTGQALGQSTAGWLSSPAFADFVKDSSNYFNPNQPQQQQNPFPSPAPKGFAQDWSSWGLGDKRWGQ